MSKRGGWNGNEASRDERQQLPPNEEPLLMWTIYDHPKDFPKSFVARPFSISCGGPPRPMQFHVEGTLEQLRQSFEAIGLTCLARSPDDDPVIVETWL